MASAFSRTAATQANDVMAMLSYLTHQNAAARRLTKKVPGVAVLATVDQVGVQGHRLTLPCIQDKKQPPFGSDSETMNVLTCSAPFQ